MRTLGSALLLVMLFLVGLMGFGHAATATTAQAPGEHECQTEVSRLKTVIGEQKSVITLLEQKIELLQKK